MWKNEYVNLQSLLTIKGHYPRALWLAAFPYQCLTSGTLQVGRFPWLLTYSVTYWLRRLCFETFASIGRYSSPPKMRRSTIFLFFAALLVHSWAIDFPHFSMFENDVDFWDEGANKRSDSASSSSSSSSSSFSSSSSSSSSSDSSDSYQIKVEEHEQKTDKYGTHEITNIHEKKKPAGGNETSSSKTIEVFRYPNGTIRRKVKTNGKGMQV